MRGTREGTGTAVPAASVGYMNRWTIPETGRSQGSAQRLTADAAGMVVLPPVRSGKLIVNASHDGFVASEPVEVEVAENGNETIIVRLSRVQEQEGAALTLVTASGAPAAGAAVAATGESMGGALSTGQRADEKGQVTIPRSLDGQILLVTHDGSAAHAQRWTAAAGDQRWQLVAPGPPVTVRGTNSHGKNVNIGRLVIWINGMPFTGAPLSFLTRGVGAINAQGYWAGRNLPPGPLRIMATTSSGAELLVSRQHDTASTTIGYPWPAQVVLRVHGW